MRVRLLSYTPNIEPLIAVALLTTSTPFNPRDIYRRLLSDAERTRTILRRVELHHGSLLEHNKLCWLLEASKEEISELLGESHFFYVTPLGGSRWLVSSNLRTALRYIQRHKNELSEEMFETLKDVAPNILENLRRGQP